MTNDFIDFTYSDLHFKDVSNNKFITISITTY